jgi:hypothetical protein
MDFWIFCRKILNNRIGNAFDMLVKECKDIILHDIQEPFSINGAENPFKFDVLLRECQVTEVAVKRIADRNQIRAAFSSIEEQFADAMRGLLFSHPAQAEE